MTSRLALGLALGVLLAAEASAQRRDDPRANDPSTCPYTEGDPERLAAAGLVSLGGFAFARADTTAIDNLLGACDIRWVETDHFQIGMGLGPYRVPQKEKKKIRAELEELAVKLPEVKPDAKVLDSWLRAHLFAQRVEKTYARFLEIMQVEQSAFPPGPRTWLIGTPYMGEGPHVGQEGKFEILLVPTEADHVAFLRDQFGLRVRMTQRWNITDTETLLVSIHTRQGSLRKDTAMHGHVVFNVAAMLKDGYRHYSYDTPPWLIEGLAHFMEREVDPRYNSFDSSEGAISPKSRKSDWPGEVRKLIRTKKAPRLAELTRLRDFSDLELPHHFVCWSMTKFLIEEHPDAYAALNLRLHGRMTEEGVPDGSDLPGVLRAAFREELGMSFAGFDEAWREWAEKK